MHVVISWSGGVGKALAGGLRELLGELFPTAKCWTSDRDIRPGEAWFEDVLRSVSDATIGVAIISRESLASQWQAFEAGLLFRSIGVRNIIPLLFDVTTSELSGPFAQLQAREFEWRDIVALVHDLNSRQKEPAQTQWIDRHLNDARTEFEACVLKARQSHSSSGHARPQSEMLAEIVDAVRGIAIRINETAQVSTGIDGLNRAAEKIKCEIRLFDKRTHNCLYRNELARVSERASEELELRDTVSALASRMRVNGKNRAETLLWDINRGKWRRRRLFDCDYCWWLVDDWDPVDASADGADLSYWRLFSDADWKVRLQELSLLLERELGITRLRLYRVAKLSQGTEGQSEFLMQPVWQRGGGFDPDAETWIRHEYPVSESIAASKVFDSSGERLEWFIGPGVNSRSTSAGARGIIFGNAGSRADVPVWSNNEPCALLALDRRNDHLCGGSERQGIHGTEVSDRDMRRIAGLIGAVRPMVADAVRERDHERRNEWGKKLSAMITRAAGMDNGRLALEHALSQVRSEWLAGGVPVRDIYVMYARSDDRLEPWAGVGPVYECRRGRTYKQRKPFSLVVDGPAVLHDFQLWLGRVAESERKEIESAFRGREDVLGSIGSWLGIPIRQGKARIGILVMCVERKFYFTETRVEGIEDSANRFMPLLLWGIAQEAPASVRKARVDL